MGYQTMHRMLNRVITATQCQMVQKVITVPGPVTLKLSTEGGYNHRLVSAATDSGEHTIAPLFEAEHVGSASVEAGITYAHMESFFNTGSKRFR